MTGPANSDSVRVARDCEAGMVACTPRTCACQVSGIILTPEQARYLYDAANEYDRRIPAETHRPLWIADLERVLREAGGDEGATQ